MTRIRESRKRGGFTLTELAIVLGVMGAIAATIWVAASNARETQRGSDAGTEMQIVVQNISTLMAGRSFTGVFYPAAASNQTGNMITAQTIPTPYVQTATTANTPWQPGDFYVWALAAKSFRVSFYQVTYQGCVALLLRGTSCQTGQAGCPTQVGTAGSPTPSAPTHTSTPAATTGWSTVMGASAANTLCGFNNYTGGTNSVEFDYSL